MASTSPGTSTTVLQGVPVVPGVRFAPVIRTNRLPSVEQLDPGGELAEPERPGEAPPIATAPKSLAP